MRTRQRLLKLLLGTVMGFVLFEILLQVTPRSWMPAEFRILDRVYTGRVKWQEMMVGDPQLGYRYRPDLDVEFPSEGRSIRIRTTSHGLGDIGFRDLGTRPPFDIVTIGDSFTFCDDVEDEHCWVKHLGEASGRNVGSLGVSGYSTLAEARVLDLYGRKLQPSPKAVILGIFPNDFNDNIEFDAWTSSNAPNFWEWRGQREGRGPFFRWLANNLVMLRLFDGAFRTTGRHMYAYKKGEVDLIFQPWWLEPMDAERQRHRDTGWQLMQQGIEKVRTVSREMGAEPMVVMIPTKEEVYFDLVRQDLPNHEKLDVDRPFGPLREYCKAQNLACCDLMPALREQAAQGKQLYLRISSHWNDLGNRVGADAMQKCLQETGLSARIAAAAR